MFGLTHQIDIFNYVERELFRHKTFLCECVFVYTISSFGGDKYKLVARAIVQSILSGVMPNNKWIIPTYSIRCSINRHSSHFIIWFSFFNGFLFSIYIYELTPLLGVDNKWQVNSKHHLMNSFHTNSLKILRRKNIKFIIIVCCVYIWVSTGGMVNIVRHLICIQCSFISKTVWEILSRHFPEQFYRLSHVDCIIMFNAQTKQWVDI